MSYNEPDRQRLDNAEAYLGCLTAMMLFLFGLLATAMFHMAYFLNR